MPELIKNKNQLASSKIRRQALDILEYGISSVLPDRLISSSISFDQDKKVLRVFDRQHALPGRIFVIGVGKASGLMAQTIERLIGPGLITAGIVVEKADPADFETERIQILQAGHPIPDSRGEKAAESILLLKSQFSIGELDAILCLISGGGSALLSSPAEGITLEDKQTTSRLLIASGADIREINSVRKHLSRVKGGRLAGFFSPAKVISLIISDVIGNDLSVIASGLTYPDPSTYGDALSVLKKYGLTARAPPNIVEHLKRGSLGEREETPKSLDNAFNYILGDIHLALEAMQRKAQDLGLRPLILSAEQAGDTEEVARQRADEILAGKYPGYNALLIGGETTPSIPQKHGKGGRNQHFAALTPIFFEGYPKKWVLASAGTDGSDYVADVAGGIVDDQSLAAFRRLRPDYMDPLRSYDSYTLLESVGNSLIVTGDTHTNVGDLVIYLLP